MALTLLLYAAMGVLMIDSIIELAFVSTMVSWLHRTANGTIAVKATDGALFDLAWKPKHLLLNQGHTTNGAAGTAFVLVGIVGILILWLRRRADNHHPNKITELLYQVWALLSVLACFLTTAALGYVFAVTNAHSGQKIDEGVARKLNAGGDKYPLGKWTPQGWFGVLLKLDLVDGRVRGDISRHLRVMRGWQYNLIVMFVLQLLTTVLILVEFVQRRRRRRLGTRERTAVAK